MTGKNRLFLFLGVCLFVSGCGPKPGASAAKDIVVTVNNYTITREEFESEFRDSAYGKLDTPESRQNFLNTLIDRKLILQAAQKEGLDKEKSFLKTIEKFWEQSLLKAALEKKTNEIAVQGVVPDWNAQRAEEAKRMNDWISELRKNARITVKEGALLPKADPSQAGKSAARKGGQ